MLQDGVKMHKNDEFLVGKQKKAEKRFEKTTIFAKFTPLLKDRCVFQWLKAIFLGGIREILKKMHCACLTRWKIYVY